MAKHTVLLTIGMAVLALMLTACASNGGSNGDSVISNRCITYQELTELMKKGAVDLIHTVVKQECP